LAAFVNPVYSIFVYVVWFMSVYFIVLFLLYMFEGRKNLFKRPKELVRSDLPKVSMIISAFNEEGNIKHTISSLKRIDYPKDKIEFIIINDGSRDRTCKEVRKHIDKRFVFLDNKVNKGKAACLNQGIGAATGDLVATMDADSVVEREILRKTVPYFKSQKTGAVTVSVEVKDPKTFMEKIIELEYIIGLSLFLKVFSFAKCIHVTPGPFSIYRKSMLDEIGGFDAKNITEDLEIAYRIRRAGYDIDCCMSAKVRTKIPTTVKGLYRQRKRWYTGALLTVWQHRDMVGRSKWGVFGYFLAFHYSLVILGMGLFLYTTYLAASNFIKKLYFYYLTGFNFHWEFELDPLSISIFYFFGFSALIVSILMLYLGMKASRKSMSNRKLGIFGYLYIFFMYQIFWISSIFSAITGRRVKWR